MKYIIGIFIDLGVQAFCMGFQLFMKVFNKWYKEIFHLKAMKNENAVIKNLIHIFQRGIDMGTLIGMIVTFFVSYCIVMLNDEIQDVKTWA